MSNNKFFQPANPTIIYIKGLKNFYGYRIMNKDDHPIFSHSEYNHNLAELDALNNAIIQLKLNGNPSHIQVRSNLEWLKRIITGENIPAESRELFELFEKLSENLSIDPQWVGKDDRNEKESDISDPGELDRAIKILNELDVICQDQKKHSNYKSEF